MGIKIWCSPYILQKHWSNPSSITFPFSCFLFTLNVSVSLHCSWTFLIMSFLCFKSSLVVNGHFNLSFLELLKKWLNPLNNLNVLRGENFDNSLSNMSTVVNIVAKVFLIFFFFISDFSQFSIFGFSGHCLWSYSHLGPSIHLLSSLHISQPLLPRSALYSFVWTYFHSTKLFPLILDTLLLTNVLYSLLFFNQWTTVVMTTHTFFLRGLIRQVLTFSARSADICFATNSKRSIDKFFLGNLDLLVIKFWLNKFSWFIPEYATVQTPLNLV